MSLTSLTSLFDQSSAQENVIDNDIPSGYRVTIQRTSYSPNKRPIKVVGYLPQEFQFGVNAEFDRPFANVAENVVQGMTLGMGKTIAGVMGTSLVSPVLTANIWQGSTTSEMTLELHFEAKNNALQEIRQPLLNLLELVTPKLTDQGLMESPASYLKVSPQDAVAFFENARKTITAVSTGSSSSGSFGNSLLNTISGALTEVTNTASSYLSGALSTANQESLEKLKDTGKQIGNMVMDAVSEANPTSSLKKLNTASYWQQALDSVVSVRIGDYVEFPCVVIKSVSSTLESMIDRDTGWPTHATISVTFEPMFASTIEDMQVNFLGGSSAGSGSGIPSLNEFARSAGATLANKATDGISSLTNQAVDKFKSLF